MRGLNSRPEKKKFEKDERVEMGDMDTGHQLHLTEVSPEIKENARMWVGTL